MVEGNLQERMEQLRRSHNRGLEELSEAVRSRRLGRADRPGWSGQDPTGARDSRHTPRGAPRRSLAGRARQRHRARGGCAGCGERTGGRPRPASSARFRRTRRWSSSCATSPGGCSAWSSSTTVNTSSTRRRPLQRHGRNGSRPPAHRDEPRAVERTDEVLLSVGPLALPAAVELFIDRARAARPGLAQTSPRLLSSTTSAAGWTAFLWPLNSPPPDSFLRLATLAERLDDRFRLLTIGARTALPRQQTLRAVVDWSYDLLFEDERRLFARLSVFAGGCDLDAAEAVCADDQVPAGEISMFCPAGRQVPRRRPDSGGDSRFTQLQTLWRYGRDRLHESGEVDTMRARHAAYYRQMAEEAHKGLQGATGPIWRERLTAKLGNLRAALRLVHRPRRCR